VLDALVVGAGGVGSAALYHLARRGLSVRGVDRFAPPHDWGSSHGDTRVIRLAYFEHPDYVPLLRRAYALWEELAQATRQELYVECGALQVGPPQGALLPGLDKAAAEHDLVLERFDATSFAARWPGFVLPEGAEARFEQRAGFLRVEDCIAAHLQLAQAAGAELVTDTVVSGWQRRGPDHVEVETSAGILAARRLIVTPGAWAPGLLAGLKVPLRVTRQALFWFEAEELQARAGGAPVYFYELGDGRFYYGFPAEGGAAKAARHYGGSEVADPLALDRELRPAEEADLRAFLSGHLRGVGGARLRHAVCMYTNTPDENFLVGRHPDAGEVVFAAGLSGHGFKFASALGEALAALATDEETPASVAFLSPTRFGY